VAPVGEKGINPVSTAEFIVSIRWWILGVSLFVLVVVIGTMLWAWWWYPRQFEKARKRGSSV
jgi:hypothetical protein